MGQAAQLTKGLMARYGAPNIFLSLAAFPLAVHLPTFFSKYYGIAFGTVGALIFLSRLTDVITDPLIGTWSDKARSRFGRRKPFILAGVPIFMISIWFLFVPIDGMVTEGYVLFFIILLYFSYTLADLPYKAWGAELSHNYEERSRVTGWREGFGLAGLIMALAIPVVVDVLFPAAEGEAAMPRWMFAIAVVTVIGTPFLFFLTLKTVPEPAPDQLAQKRVGWGQGLRIVWQNKAFMKMLVALVAIVIGGTMTATLGLPFVTNVLDLPEQSYPFIILGYYAGATAFVPLWVKLSDRIGKHKAVALALQAVPDANAVWAGDRMLKLKPSDVAVAVAIEGGLFTPVLRDSEMKSLSALSAEMKDLATRARDRKLAPHEYQGGSFAISNLGMFGIDNFDAVINPPHASILAVGAGKSQPVVKSGELAIATVMSVTLSVDHRVIDGALGAQFLDAIKANLEDPMMMLV